MGEMIKRSVEQQILQAVSPVGTNQDSNRFQIEVEQDTRAAAGRKELNSNSTIKIMGKEKERETV